MIILTILLKLSNMVRVSASEFKRRSGEYLEKALKEEVVVSKRNRPTAVVVDYETYETLKKRVEDLEDRLWGLMAEIVYEKGRFEEVDPEDLLNV